MATATTDDWTTAPYAEWLEESVQEIVSCDPPCMVMAWIDEDGFVYTSFYHNATADELAAIINVLEDEKRRQWVIDNKEDILAILNDEEDEESDE